MTRIMIIVGSVRPGRVGLSVAEWVRDRVQETVQRDGHGGGDAASIDLVDLAELNLPFLDEPHHPVKKQYTKPHTVAWSERVSAADAIVLVSPEYNHSYSPALKNAIDFLFTEWAHKPVAVVSYGGASAGTRGVAALDPVLSTVGLVKIAANPEINFIGSKMVDGVFQGDDKLAGTVAAMTTQLIETAEALTPLR
ncbi:NADPH-dependent FMN reductase [Yonghaparkia sp. Soil809]|uniref:NADPH-dependent FMN reductase n=1 Tax=Yonghaparkia sp. Soil809 TaxID=1736417 RepID=UPI0006F51B96|nr:NAD(P)H-dependent oxidoreductase [Yonghaparkia sp. Soil809]KRF32911.1 NADPH-dependent FMN reductase [Yonghaparkia sp. Soil809]